MKDENLSIGNAAGTIKSMLDVERACGRNAMTEITVGSVTKEPREGNVPDKPYGRVYYAHPNGTWSLNALGLPNMGFEAYRRILPDMVRAAHSSAGKQLRVSVAGESPDEYATMAEQCYALGVDAVELNLGCPNVWGDGGVQKPIPSFMPSLTEQILDDVCRRLPKGRTVDVKISPVKEIAILLELARIFNKSGCVGSVVGVNTVPNVERLGHDAHHALAFNNGNNKGGLAGLEIATASFFTHDTIRHVLNDSIGYKAVGGITGGMLAKHVNEGATGFQIATDYIERGGPAAFTSILEDFARIREELKSSVM